MQQLLRFFVSTLHKLGIRAADNSHNMLDMSADISVLEKDVVDKTDEDMFMGNDDNFDIDGDKTGVFKVSINLDPFMLLVPTPPLYGASGHGPSQKFDWIIDGQHRFGRRWHKSPRLFW